MTVAHWRPARRHLALPLTALLMLGAAGVSAQPPSVQSRAARAASDAYQGCLARQLSHQPAAATPQASVVASGACAREEAAVYTALLKENPDRPLFARSYLETLREAAVSRVATRPVLPFTVAQHNAL